VTDRLDVVAVGVEHKRAVVAGVIARPEARRAVVGSARGEGGGVKCVDGLPVRGRERQVERRCRIAGPDEEVDAARRAPADRSLDLDLLDAERRQRSAVELLARLEVANREREVVDEDVCRDGRTLRRGRGGRLPHD
jgi:hypothetical protein